MYVTKHGDEISFKSKNNNKHQPPYLVQHEIKAFVKNEEVGYIKIGYSPKKHWEKYFPTLWQFAEEVAGWHVFDTYPESILTTWTPEQKARMVNNVDGYMHFAYTHGYENMTADRVEAIWDSVIKSLETHMKDKYEKSYAFNVDRPIVDYIRASVTRQHIGLALYKYAAKWIHEKKKLRLYASDTQSIEAQKTWAKMAEMGWIDTNGKGKYIRPDIT